MRSALIWITAVLVSLGSGVAGAQRYPSQPVRIIASAPPARRWTSARAGSPSSSRPCSASPSWWRTRAGRAGTSAWRPRPGARPTATRSLIVHQGTLAINPHIYARVGYDPDRRLCAGDAPPRRALLLAVNSQFPARSVADLVRMAKEQPGRLSYGSSGAGTPPHMAGELFRRAAGIEVAHVPYKGAAAALADLLGGRLAYTIDGTVIQGPQRPGREAAPARGDEPGADRDPAGRSDHGRGWPPGLRLRVMDGSGRPRCDASAIVERLNAELVKALRTREAREWFQAQGAVPVGDAPEQFAAFIRAEHARWGAVVREAGIRAD